VKLSEKAQEVIEYLKLGNIGQSVIVTLTLLLLFLNIVLLTRKKYLLIDFIKTKIEKPKKGKDQKKVPTNNCWSFLLF
jgi:hypothetical protein